MEQNLRAATELNFVRSIWSKAVGVGMEGKQTLPGVVTLYDIVCRPTLPA
jgi:hypothetical protein